MSVSSVVDLAACDGEVNNRCRLTVNKASRDSVVVVDSAPHGGTLRDDTAYVCVICCFLNYYHVSYSRHALSSYLQTALHAFPVAA